MPSSIGDSSVSAAPGTPGRHAPPRRLLGAGLLLASSMAAFAALGAALVAILSSRMGLADPEGFYLRCGIKAGVFGAAAVAALAGAWVLLRGDRTAGPLEEEAAPSAAFTWAGSSLLLGLMALLLFPRLDKTPYPESDEIHHLLTARNFAFFDAYASGRPETEFRVFDPWDSVGAPVLVPVAWAYRWTGRAGWGVARILSVLWFVLLAWQVLRLVAPSFGWTGAAAACLLLLALPGSIYLARTVYGEVPGLALFLLSLNLLAYAGRGHVFAHWSAGIVFGWALLAKPTLVLFCVPLAAALCFHLLTAHPRVWSRAVGMACGTLAVLGGWSFLERTVRAGAEAQPEAMFALYRPFLLFGLDGLPQTAAVVRPVYLSALAAALGVAWAWPRVLRHPSIAPLTVLFAAPFAAFWFLFFTAGNLFRYFWPSLALAAIFAGPALVQAMRCAAAPARRWHRVPAGIYLVLTASFAAPNLNHEVRRIAWANETQPLRGLADYVRGLQPAQPVVTTFWPLRGAMDLLAGRHVPVVEAAATAPGQTVIGLEGQLPRATKRWGPFAARPGETGP